MITIVIFLMIGIVIGIIIIAKIADSPNNDFD